MWEGQSVKGWFTCSHFEMCTKHKLGNNRGNGEGNYIGSFLFFFGVVGKKLGRWGWLNWRQKLFICGHTNIIMRKRRFCSSPGLKRKLVWFKRDVEFFRIQSIFRKLPFVRPTDQVLRKDGGEREIMLRFLRKSRAIESRFQEAVWTNKTTYPGRFW